MSAPLSKLGESSHESSCLLILKKKNYLSVALAAGGGACPAHTGHPPTTLSPPRAAVPYSLETSPTNS